MTSPYRNERASLLQQRVVLRQELRHVEARLRASAGPQRRRWAERAVAALAGTWLLVALGKYVCTGSTCPLAPVDPEPRVHEPVAYEPMVRDFEAIRSELESERQRVRGAGMSRPKVPRPSKVPGCCPPGDPLCN